MTLDTKLVQHPSSAPLCEFRLPRDFTDGYIGVDDILKMLSLYEHLVRNKPTAKKTE